jgi:DNA-binding LacI/PurR family transcriptional regulator
MPPSRTTIADVAQQAGVSIATVSRVLNGTAPVETETAERVRSAIAALNYFPHAAARTLASRRTDTIGLLLPEIGGAFFQPMLRGVEAGVSEAGFDLLIHTTQSRPENAPHRPLGEHNTDGLLVFTESLDAKELTRLHSIGFPVVLLHQAPPNSLDIPVVTIENQFGAQKIVEHLIEVHHCQRIVYLQGPEGHEDSTWREKGYRLALKTHDITFDPSLVMRGNFDRDIARISVEQLLANDMAFDAVFTGDDESAIGVLMALRQAGRRVPEDVAVVGFDDSLIARTLVPLLTTVHAPTEQVGREAVRQLIRIIRGETVEPRLVLSTELTIRQSCGCHA